MISLCMDQMDYENDIRALLMAFFYGEKILLSAPEWSHRLTVSYAPGCVRMVFEDREGNRREGEAPCSLQDYKLARNQVKRLTYGLLSAYTNVTLPWGTLTGIRPTKLAMEMLEQGKGREEIVAHLTDKYLASEEKAGLCVDVADNERRVLAGLDYDHSYSLYVGIPFCPSICAYCSFSSYPLKVWQDQVDAYIDALIREIEACAGFFPDRYPVTIYMGGGTPTSLSPRQMDRLLSAIEKHFDLSKAREKTVEAGRPDSITPEKLKVIKDHGVDRISINPQSMNQETLDLIGRRHSTEDVIRAYGQAVAAGFDNINMDLIAGLPGETHVHMERTMEAVTRLNPASVTVHSLALKRAAFLNQNRELFPVAPADEVNRMIRISREGAAKIGARPYYLYRQKNIAGNLENVGYARYGCEGLYNILIMEEKQSILALGTGASSKFVLPSDEGVRIERVENVKSVKDYIERTDEMIRRKSDFFAAHVF